MRGDSRNNWRQDKDFLEAVNDTSGLSAFRKGNWAVYGVPRGHQIGYEGESYAIQTVTKPGAKRSIPLEEIYSQLLDLGKFAVNYPEKTIYCTINGGGLNGYSKEEIKALYTRWEKENPPPMNIIFPENMKSTKKIIIAGSRDFKDYSYMKDSLDSIVSKGDTIISGTAKGADSLGEKYAAEHGLKVIRMPAQWDKFGKSAGYKRNEEMAKTAQICCVFWDGQSKGSKHMIDLARKYGLEVHIFKF